MEGGGQLGYRDSPICYQFDPVSLLGVQSQNEVAGAGALQALDMAFSQRIVYDHVVSSFGFLLFNLPT